MKTYLNLIKYFGLLTLFIFTSCVNDDTNVTPANEKPTLNVTQTDFTLVRGETVGIPITISRPINDIISVELRVVGGTARKSFDFVVGDGDISADFGNPNESFSVDIPATSETFEIPLTALESPSDDTYNTVELEIKAIGTRFALFPGDGSQFITVNLLPSSNFVARLDWEATYTDVDGDPQTFCDFDMDLEFYDELGNIVAASYTECPEEIIIAPGDLPDGNYLIVPSFWSRAGAPLPVDFENIPVTMFASQPGVFVEEYDLSEVPEWADFDFGVAEGNGAAYLFDISMLTISGSNFTVTSL